VEAEPVHFDLVGARSYVRSTDVLRAALLRCPAKDLTVKFLRPLCGPALLSSEPVPHVAVAVTTAQSSFALITDPEAKVTRILTRPAAAFALRLRLTGWQFFLFSPRASIADRIERCFDIVHPELGETYVVRSIHVVQPRAALVPLLWFRIHRAPTADRAELTMRTPLGRLADVRFKLAPKGR